MTRISLSFVAALAAATIATPALAAFESAYTDIDLDQCTIIETSDFGTVWACAGHKGFPGAHRRGRSPVLRLLRFWRR